MAAVKGQWSCADHVQCSPAFGSIMTFHPDLGSANTLPITKLQGTVTQF